MSTPSGAELVVRQLGSLDKEEIYRNAEKKTVHSVIKNIPFPIELSLSGSFDHYAVDFHKFTLQSTLLYDTQSEERAVDWVKSSPIDCNFQINETGEQATAEVRIHALSSQHEDMAFRIKFTAVPPSTSTLQPLVVVTEPIRVVSKLSQLKKNKKPPATRTKKRPQASASATDAHDPQIADSLARIEAQQRQQQTLINSLIQTVAILQHNRQAATSVVDLASPCPSHPDDFEVQQPVRKRAKTDSRDTTDQQSGSEDNRSPSYQEATQLFEHHLAGLLSTFSQVLPEERTASIHRVFGEYSDHAGEVVEALLAESLADGASDASPTGATADSSFDSAANYDDAASYEHQRHLRLDPISYAEALYKHTLLRIKAEFPES